MDIATRETLQFVRAALPADATRLLEIGCGHGALAAELAAAGYRVTALDADEQAVAMARARGLDARRIDWPAYDPPDSEARYDAILFTRSLHHMHDPASAVERAAELLAPAGVLLVEDFAVDAVDDWTADWFASLLRVLDAAGLLATERSPLVERLLTSPVPLDVWRAEHGDHVHPAQRLEAALAAVFELRGTQPTPYLYRYAVDALGPAAGRLAGELLALERVIGRARPASLIGRRYVARREAAAPA